MLPISANVQADPKQGKASLWSRIVDWLKRLFDRREYHLYSMIREEIKQVGFAISTLRGQVDTFSYQTGCKRREYGFRSEQYQAYFKALPGNLRSQESREPLSSMAVLLGNLQEELITISKDWVEAGTKDKDGNFRTAPIEYYDLRLSEVSLMGVLSFANTIHEYLSAVLFACHIEFHQHLQATRGETVTKNLFKIKFRYMHERIMSESKTLVPLMCDHLRGNMSMTKAISHDFENLGHNPKLQQDGQVNTFFETALDDLPKFTQRMCFMGLPSLNIFSHAGKKWVQYQHSRHLKREYEKNWLENHTSQLRMEKERMDPNSPEYKKHTQVIQAYEDMIADLQQDIDSYLAEVR